MKQIRQHRNRTGGGSPCNISLSEFDQKIIDVIGLSAADGDGELQEIGFGGSNQSMYIIESIFFLETMFCFLKIGNFITKGSDDLKTQQNNFNPSKLTQHHSNMKPKSQTNLRVSANENVIFDENHVSRVHPNSNVRISSNQSCQLNFTFNPSPCPSPFLTQVSCSFFLKVNASNIIHVKSTLLRFCFFFQSV